MALEDKYLDRMKHAIGLDNKAPGNGVYEAYRNCSYYDKPQVEWEELRLRGLAKCISSEDKTEFVYSLTREGLQEVANATGLLIRYTIEVEPRK